MQREVRGAGWCLGAVVALAGCTPEVTPVSVHIDVSAADDLTEEDLTISAGESITLSASAGGRTEGYAFRWELQGGPGEVEIDDPTSRVIQAGPFIVLGEYKFRVLVSTVEGRFGQAFVIVTVEEADPDNVNETDNENENENGDDNDNTNENVNDNDNDNENENDNTPPPENVAARFNSPLRLAVGTSAPLRAVPPGGDLRADFEWVVLSGDVTVEDPEARVTTITASSPGPAEVRLFMKVIEPPEEFVANATIEATAEGTFSIYARAEPIAAPSGETVQLNVDQVNVAVPVGGRVVYQWEILEGSGDFVSAQAQSTGFTPTSVGEVRLRVNAAAEPDGGEATDELLVMVRPNPSIGLEGNAENLLLVGEPTELTVSATNVDEELVTFEWRVVSGDATISNSTGATASVTANSIGTAVLEAAASADVEGVSASGTMTFFATAVTDFHPKVNIVIEGLGQIPLELNGEAAPITVANFLHYVDDEGFDGLTFHRVIPDFVVQAGGFRIEDGEYVEAEPARDTIPTESDNGQSNVRSTVAMALLGANPNSGDRQFFINLVDENSFLDDQSFTVFGEVTGTGMTVADALSIVETNTDDRPIEPLVISSIRRVEEN